MKKLRLDNTYLECGLRFFIFIKERLQNVKKMTKKKGKNRVHDFMRCACMQARGLAQTIFKQLGRPNFTYAEGLVKS